VITEVTLRATAVGEEFSPRRDHA